MAVQRLWVRGYRSLRDVDLALTPLTVVHGANGSGKTNLYRALLLLSRAATGRLASTVLEDGGMPSMLWAGAPARSAGRTRRPVRLVVGVEQDGLGYELALGLPSLPPSSPFVRDAEVKEEVVWFGPQRTRRSTLVDRAGTAVIATEADGARTSLGDALDRSESVLAQLREPGRFPELHDLRWRLAGWRFHHDLPTGAGVPARAPQAGVLTPVLADDGHDLAAALATIVEMDKGDLLDAAVADAFPGWALAVDAEDGRFAVHVEVPGVRRALSGHELSDGTLRYLYLLAALLTARPPELLVLNEPEGSLHDDLLAPLATLVAALAASGTQVLVTTHAPRLAGLLGATAGATLLAVARDEDGATTVAAGAGPPDGA